MKFCKKCGGLLFPVKKTSNSIHLQCRKCANKEILPAEEASFKTKTEFKVEASIPVVDSEQEAKKMSVISVECPKCHNIGAMWWMVQTRAGDEPATRFYRCIKCKHTWRESH